MEPNNAVPTKTQSIDSVAEVSGKRSPKRLKARHLSALTKQIIVQKFSALQCARDVADEMQIPGLTGSTVFDVLHSFSLRKQPGAAQTAIGRDQRMFVVERRMA